MDPKPTPAETDDRDRVLANLTSAILAGEKIPLPPFGPAHEAASEFALLALLDAPRRFGGSVGDWGYLFEGEDDLLHLLVARLDAERLDVREARSVAEWLLPGLEPALIWLKPGERSHHFYFGHDDLIAALDRA